MANETRERILDACARVIAREGLRGFRMGDAAREAGVSIGLLSYHFGDRDGLLQAALDHVNESAARRAANDGAGSGAGASGDADARADSRAVAGPSPAPGERLAALLCSEFADEPQVRAGSTAWNELRAAAVFDAGQAEAVARSTADWQREVRRLLAEARPQTSAGAGAGSGAGSDASAPAGAGADPDSAALILTALVEGLSGRWLTGQISAAEAQLAVRRALAALGL